jgi:NAD(P) transhydrogenase
MSHFDVIVIGCGPAGERAAIQAARAGRTVAVIEKHHVVGGTAVNWGTIPSKTLRESALFVRSLRSRRLEGFEYRIADHISVADFMYRERIVVQRELELINRSLDRYRIDLFQGAAQFVDEHTVAVVGVDGQTRLRFRGDVIVIATGSSPNHPPDVPFDGECVFDSDTILQLPRMPRSMVVLGAGVIGVEYASIFAALGLQVTLVDTRDRLLPYLDREVAGVLERELRRMGIAMIHDDRHASIERRLTDPPRVLVTTKGGNLIEADVLLYAVGRDGNTKGLGLEQIGIQPNERGLLEVNEQLQTAIPHIYAVGDLIGYPALANTSMDQGRRAIRHALGIAGPAGATEALAFTIYSIPEVSYVGATEESLAGRPHVAGRGDYAMNPRGQILDETGGMLKLLFAKPSGVLLGAHIVGRGASELIHVGQAFLRNGSTAEQIAETLFNYPTLSDLYRHAALVALKELRLG